MRKISEIANALPDVPARWRFRLRVTGFTLLIGFCLVAHYQIGSAWSDAVNANLESSDQANNMRLAKIAAERAAWDARKGLGANVRDKLPHFTDGVVNPLWPWIAAGFENTDALQLPQESVVGGTVVADEAADRLFREGRRWNLGMSTLALAALACWLAWARRWPLLTVANVVLLTALAAWTPRAGWFQPEPVYYVLFLFCWLVAMQLLKHNRIWLYGVFGAATGLAYLAKASVQPLILVFLGVATLRFVGAIRPRRAGTAPVPPRAAWDASAHFIGLAVFICCHLVVIGPRLGYSQERFGSPSHSYTGYWMWMNDFEAGWDFMAEHSSREALEAMDPATTPSARLWFATHPPEAVWQRAVDGGWWQMRRLAASNPTPRDKQGAPKRPWRALLESPGRAITWLALPTAIALAAAAGMRRRDARPMLHPEAGMLALFALGSLAAYTLLHGWYTPVGDGDRFMLALVAPIVFCIAATGEAVARGMRLRGAAPVWRAACQGAHAILLLWLLARVAELLRNPYFS